MKPIQWTILLITGMLVLAGCAQAFPTVQAPQLPTLRPTEGIQAAEQPAAEEAAPVETLAVEPTAAILAEDQATLAPEEAMPDAPTAAPPTEAPTATETAPQEAEVALEPTKTTSLGSPELHASNPANVNLASGKVQLVEFFAFW
jgi:hypothetical protein